MTEQVLIVATGPLARFVPALGTMAAIRASHASAKITVLVAAEIGAFASSAPYFDDVWIDPTIGSRNLRHWRALRALLRSTGFARIYDLSNDRHSRHIFWLAYGVRGLGTSRRSIPWSGDIAGTALAY